MIKSLTLVQKFTILCLAALVIFGVIFGWVVTGVLERDMLARSNQITANVITKAVQTEFEAADLREPKTGADYEIFTDKVNHLSLGLDIERVKIWNRERVIVWADDRRLVGRQFPENERLAAALEGTIQTKLSTLEEAEHELEKEFGRLLELYVPVRFEAQSNIEVVFEVYKNLDPLYLEISRSRQIVWTYTGIGFSFLFLVLVGIVKSASRRIERQTRDIARSEEKYRSLVESAQDGIISVDCRGAIVLFNKAAEGIFGYSTGEVIGQSVAMLVPEDCRARHKAAGNRYFRMGETTIIGKTIEVEGRRKDGQRFPMELSLTASGEGEDHLVTAILRDIAERKAMQAELIEGEKQATVSLVAGSIGHELKNVATALLGYAGLLRENPGDRELAEESAEVFNKESQRMTVHATNLLTLSKPQKPEMKPICLESLLDRVTELLRVSGVLKVFSIAREYAEGLPEVPGDEMQLEQVIRNLEINAAHAMGNKGTLTITTGFSGDGSHVEFGIGDTGGGIPEDKRDQIFLPFYTTKEKGKGTGLGMYIVKQAIEQHGGYVRLKSEVGRGTTVTIGLPVSPNGALV